MTTIIRSTDPRGGLVYPFLSGEWEIKSQPLGDEVAVTHNQAAASPALRWVKDDKVLDLFVPGMNTAEFLAHTGLLPSLHKGGYVLSKRLSRVIRPFRYYGFYDQTDITLEYSPDLNPRLWDGAGLVNRSFVERMANQLPLSDHHRRELLSCGRLEVTTLHAGGQDKGHVLVVDSLTCDLLFPSGSAKTELKLTNGQVFVGFHPVHSADEMCLDVQSFVNLYPFFQVEHLLAWAGMESELFLHSIRNGRLEQVMGRLYDESDLDSLANWHVGEYLASGGQAMWFAGIVKAIAGQHLKRLGSRIEKFRCPIPGGRYYILPADVGGRDVPAGHIELDPACATAWVSDQDWLDSIVNVLGGCDGDDAVWVFPFRDEMGEERLLIWRSPNGVGEYVVLKPTIPSHTLAWETVLGKITAPTMNSHLLPPRIDRLTYHYGNLVEPNNLEEQHMPYSLQALQPAIRRAVTNQGVLGAFCNVAIVCKAIYGRLPDHLPATLEAIIDGSVKTGVDLTPVRNWNQMALSRMVAHGRQQPGYAMPHALLHRLPEHLRSQARLAETHWLDTLASALDRHRTQYQAEVNALATETCPPIELFEQGRDWMQAGKELYKTYSRVIRGTTDSDHEPDYEAAHLVCDTFLSQWSDDHRPCVLIGTIAYLYSQGTQNGEPVKDTILWQLGAKRAARGRDPGLAQTTLAALRQMGVLGEPVWTSVGAVLHYRDVPCIRCVGVPVTVNAVWYNLLRATCGTTPSQMTLVSKLQRDQAKTRVAELAHRQFVGMVLETAVTDDNRLITRTPKGNLFGYVHRDHELLAVRHSQWRIAWATAVDGNVRAILQPVV